jgi:hypothetical protein
MTDQQIIRQCIERTVRAVDGRGIAQAERLCLLNLRYQSDTIDQMTAAAARHIGEWLRTQ